MGESKEIIKAAIENGRTALGIELGSTRIKACLIDENHIPVELVFQDMQGVTEQSQE